MSYWQDYHLVLVGDLVVVVFLLVTNLKKILSVSVLKAILNKVNIDS